MGIMAWIRSTNAFKVPMDNRRILAMKILKPCCYLNELYKKFRSARIVLRIGLVDSHQWQTIDFRVPL